VREQKSRRRLGGGLNRPDYTGYDNHGSAGDSLNVDIHVGRRGYQDRHYYDNYGHDAHHYSHHDYGGLGHSFSGYYYPSYTYGYSNYYSPYYYGRYGYRFGLGFGSLSFGYSNYSYGYPGYYCSSAYYPSYYNSSDVSYTPYDYDYLGYPTAYTPVDYPIYTEEYLEPVILDEDDEDDEVLDEVDDDPFDVDFDDPFGLSQDLSGYWLADYTYTWPSWGRCRTITLDPTAALFYSGSYVLY